MKKLLLFVLCLAAVSVMACSEDKKYDVRIVVQKTGVSDCTVYAKFCDGAGQSYDCTGKYQTSVPFTSGEAVITVSDVEEGTYTAGLFIDVNDNNGTYVPDCTDDWAIGGDDFEVNDDVNITIPTDDPEWGQAPGDFPWCTTP